MSNKIINIDSLRYYNEKINQIKQDILISGQNIKTVNGTSLLGSGNVAIIPAYSEVSHGTSDTTFTLTPNVFHVWDVVASLSLTLGDETVGVANEYLFQFKSGETATTLTLPDTIKWANDSAPTIEANMIYQISILKGLGSVLKFTDLITFTIDSIKYQAEEGMTWNEWVESPYNTNGFTIESADVYQIIYSPSDKKSVGGVMTNDYTFANIIANFNYTLEDLPGPI